MQMTLDFDAIILGGGCAGLTLAVELARRGCPGRILIVESRKAYERDRTWSYWNVMPHSFQDCVTHRWNAWSVRVGSREARQRASAYAYEQIPADRFYASACKRLESAPGVTFWRGTLAAGPRAIAGGFAVDTSRGRVSSPLVFDSRPPIRSTDPPPLTQHFLGWHLRAHDPVFDPSCAVLMDFSTEPGSEIGFSYILPYSEREALVETTALSPDPFFDDDGAERSLRDYLARRLGIGHCDVGFRERGAIPMGPPVQTAPRMPAGYYPIGIRGGLVRPSTGYAFLAIQRWSQQCADAVVAGRLDAIPRRPYSAVSAWLDGIFLQRLRDEPTATPETFLGLFGKAGAAATARFLSDCAGPRDYFEVIASLPTWPFLRLAAAMSISRLMRASIGAARGQRRAALSGAGFSR